MTNKEEQQWIQERIKDIVSKPYFFRSEFLVISIVDRDKVYKAIEERFWIDRNGFGRTWYHKILVYYSEEEYLWYKLFL